MEDKVFNVFNHMDTVKPEFSNYVLINYEGLDVGTVYLTDINTDKDNKELKFGQFLLVKRCEMVDASISSGIIKYFSDIQKWKDKAPLYIYSIKYII